MKNIAKSIVAPIILALLFTACASTITSTPEPVVTVYLNDLEPSSISVGFSELGRGVNPFTEDKLIEGEPIAAHNTTYPHGLFAHAPSQIEYKIDGAYSSIAGYVLMHDGINCGDGVKFQVLADKHEVYSSPVLNSTSAPLAFESNLTGAQVLTLKVDSISNMDCDWSVWGDPVLTKIDTPSVVVAAENTSTPTTLPTALATATSIPPTATSMPTFTPTPIPLPNHPGWVPDGAIARFGMGGAGGIAVSPDNSIVAIAGTSGVHLLNPLTGHTVDFLETGMDPFDATFSPDGQKLFISLGFGGVAIWNHDAAGPWTQEEIFPSPCAVNLEISPNGEILFTKCFSNQNNRFVAWDLAAKTQLYQINYAQPDISFAMAFSPSNPDLMAVAANQTVTLMDVKGGRTLNTYYEPNKNKVVDLDFSPDGSLLAITSESPEVILLNVESAEEVERIKLDANMRQLSFMDNKTFISIMENSTAIVNVNGTITKRLNSASGGYSHVYVPGNHILVLAQGGKVASISMDTYKVIGEVDGFNLYSRYEASISGDGNAFIIGDTLMRTNEFRKFTYLDVHKFCNDPQPPTHFIDNEGKYIYLWCGENKLMVAELATMNVISSFDRPLRWALNTDPQRHPWADDQTLLVLLYENPKSSPVKYRIEVWNPTRNKKTLDVNVPEFQPSDISGTQLFISPRSKYLVIMLPDGKSILSYDLDSGALVQNIKLNTPRPLSTYLDEGMFSNDDTIFFIRHANFVEAYSIESGALIQKISGLQLIKGNTCATFCPGDKNNFAYFDETKTFVNYYNVSDALSFSTYDLESGQKISTTSIQLPYILKNGEKVDRKKHVFSIGLVYLPPEHNGNIAVVGAKLQPVGNRLYDSTIYVVDIPTNTILKSYTWQHSAWNISFLAFKDFLLVRQSPTPIYFLWDISTP